MMWAAHESRARLPPLRPWQQRKGDEMAGNCTNPNLEAKPLNSNSNINTVALSCFADAPASYTSD
jgi:hypothetical protein